MNMCLFCANYRLAPSLFLAIIIVFLSSETSYSRTSFGIFPRAGGCFEDAWRFWPKNSVGNILDMTLQILEEVALLHDQNIAHRGFFECHPESLLSDEIAVDKPRVYIIDFELAIDFPVDHPPEERVCTGVPCPKWYSRDDYTRPCSPEIDDNSPWCPFNLDVWQLG
ncbi:hypothetical protein QCA50_005270 [Cerrena zonata]|uniref:Protein kinase domain-containing protein n=1 Tax=Cerrena zonata TaxID=2478898 RepID=A0AAW0GEQ0_9APHY